MTNTREVKPTRVPLTIYENSHGRFPTLLFQLLIIGGFVAAAFIFIACDHMKWSTWATGYNWKTVLDMPDASAIMIRKSYNGSPETYYIYDKEHKDVKGGKWKYGTALPDTAYLATGKLFEGKYPEIYLDPSKTRVAYINIDFSIPENRAKTNYIGIE